MLKYFEGSVFNVGAQALVNAVNCVGVMGAGIALAFKLRYPAMFEDYKIKCKNEKIITGKVDYYKNEDGTIIVNFPTKYHFKYPSQLIWIEQGLQDFVKTYQKHGITSVAFPKLGTGNGGLNWNEVKALMEKYLMNLDIDVYICLNNKKEAEGNKGKTNMYKRIAVIGSRQLAVQSKEIKENVTKAFKEFVETHKPEWIVSGNAEGADNLSHLYDNNLQYLPWPGYNKHLMVNGKSIVAGNITVFDKEIFEMFPWMKTKVNSPVMKLIRRNFAMIRGIKPGNQVDAILYWVPGNEVTSGTKYAYDLGKKLGIPMFPLNSNHQSEKEL